MNSPFCAGGSGGNGRKTPPPNPPSHLNSTPHSHHHHHNYPSKISNSAATGGNNAPPPPTAGASADFRQNNGGGDNTNRARSHTDTALLNANKHSSFDAGVGQQQQHLVEMLMAADSTVPYKQRLYGLFSLIEREMEALHIENCALRARLGLGVQSADRAVNETETPRRAVHQLQNIFANEMIEQKMIVGKKSSQTRQPKWKSAFKNPSGRLALKVGANFPATESKHRFVQNFKGHTDGVWHVCTAQVGTTNILASASADQSAKIWLADNGAHPLATYSGHVGSVNSIAILPAYPGLYGSQLTMLTCSGDQSAHIWRPNLENVLERRREKGGGGQSHENEDDQFSQQIGQPLLKLTGHTDAIMDGNWLFGGEKIITVSWDRTANLYDAESGKVLKTLSGHDQELTSCSAHPSQKLLATASRDFTFRLWDFREPIHSVAVFQGHNDSVTSVVFSTLHHIVSGSDDRTVKVWDLRNMRSPISAIRLDSAANRIGICQQRNLLAIPLDSRNISIYDLNGTRQTRIPRSTGKCHHRLVSAAAWIPDHPMNNLITSGFDKQVIGWRVNLPNQVGNKM